MDINILAGPPVSVEEQIRIGLKDYQPKEGAVTVPCDLCHEELWLGARQLTMRVESKKPMPVVCFGCAKKIDNVEGVKSLDKKAV